MTPPKVSVLIPAYNAAETIRATLESVLSQTLPPSEILVMDDGSTDDTALIVKSYEPRVALFQQENRGLAGARNPLCRQAQGDLVAFIDSDDLWHPRYLEAQCHQFSLHPDAVALYTGHFNLMGQGGWEWDAGEPDLDQPVEVLDSFNFFRKLVVNSGTFGPPSFLCVPGRVLSQFGDRPFCEQLRRAEDFHFSSRLALMGPAVYFPSPLVGYRIRADSLSANILRQRAAVVDAFDLLERDGCFRSGAGGRLYQAFNTAFASARRSYAKVLMAAGMKPQARTQLGRSLAHSYQPASLAKSLGILMLTYVPNRFRPILTAGERG